VEAPEDGESSSAFDHNINEAITHGKQSVQHLPSTPICLKITNNVCRPVYWPNAHSDPFSTAEFTIQPHPAKTNNPSDLGQDPSASAGLVGSSPNALESTGPGLQVLSDEQARGLETPKSREEVSSSMHSLNGPAAHSYPG
jgi:hypothetical protein